MDAQTKAYYLGQAYGMRAYVYFHLLRSWGDVVLHLDYTDGNSINVGNTAKAASPAADVMKQIKSDIQNSEDAFGEDYSFKNGRCYWSKAATMMLKGEVYLWSGKQMNGGKSDFETAKTALLAVKNADVALLNDFSKVFSYKNKENKEIIFTMHSGRDEFSMWNDQYRMTMVMGSTHFDNYCDEEGTPLNDTEVKEIDGLIQYQIDKDVYTQLFREGDQRKAASIKGIFKRIKKRMLLHLLLLSHGSSRESCWKVMRVVAG